MTQDKSSFTTTVVNSTIGSLSQGDGRFQNLRPRRSQGGPSDHAQIESFIGGSYVRAPFKKGDKVVVKDDGVHEKTPSIKGIVFTVWSLPVEVPTGSGKTVWICSIVDEALPISQRTEYGVVATILEHAEPPLSVRFLVGSNVKVSAYGSTRTHVHGIYKDATAIWRTAWVPVGESSLVFNTAQLYGTMYYAIAVKDRGTHVLIAERDLEEEELWDFDTDTST